MLRTHQKESASLLINRIKRHALFIEPRRSGKSVRSFYIAMSTIFKNWSQPMNIIIVAPEQIQCREIYLDNILDNGTKLIDIIPVGYGKLNKTYLQYEFKNGSSIKFRGSDRIDSRMGSGAYMIIIDEFDMSKPEVYQRLYPMVQQTNGQIIIQTTPRGKGLAYNLMQIVKDNQDWYVSHKGAIELGLMTQEEYDAIPMDANYKAQEYLCSFDSPFENAIYLALQIKDIAIYTGYNLYASIDIGYTDKTVVIFAQVDEQGKILITHCIECNLTKMELIIQYIYDYVYNTGIHLTKIFVPHDGMHNRVNAEFTVYDKMLNARLPCELIPMRGINEMIEVVRSKWHDIYFNTTCTNLIEAIKAYIVKNGKSIHSDHADALRYLIYGILNMPDGNVIIATRYEPKYNYRR
jgi:Terminase large subunit, T4likevirus-type, N-terminal